jgi:hypothetical protein
MHHKTPDWPDTPLFHAEGLPNTQEHNIVITSLNTNEWWLDYMVYRTQNSSLSGGGGSITDLGQVRVVVEGYRTSVLSLREWCQGWWLYWRLQR